MSGTSTSGGCPDCPKQGALTAPMLLHTRCNPPVGSGMAEASVLGAHKDLILSVSTFSLSLTSALIFYVVALVKFSITAVRFLALAAPAGWRRYRHYEGSLPSGIFKHFLVSGIFLRASHIPEAVNKVAEHSNRQHICNIHQAVPMAGQTRSTTQIDELHHPVKKTSGTVRGFPSPLVRTPGGAKGGKPRTVKNPSDVGC